MVKLEMVANILKNITQPGDVTVVSAFKGVTDLLISCADKSSRSEDYSEELGKIENIHNNVLKENELDFKVIEEIFGELKNVLENGEEGPKFSALLQSFGERLSSRVLAAKLKKMKFNSEAFDAFDIGMKTTSNHLNSCPLEDSMELIAKSELSSFDGLAVVTGYIGKDESGDICLLGNRGGSDFSATYIGAALKAEKIEIWTDTLFRTADPRDVENTKILRSLSYEEAEQLAYYGAKILHPRSIGPPKRANVPIVIRDTFHEKDEGTLITEKKQIKKGIVKSVTSKQVYVVRTSSVEHAYESGFASFVFDAFKKHEVSVDMISTSNTEIACTVDAKTCDVSCLNKVVGDINSKYCNNSAIVEDKKTQINIIGEGMRDNAGVAARIFSTLDVYRINDELISQGNDINLGIVVDGKSGLEAVKAIHKAYFG